MKCNLKDILDLAVKGSYAIGAFNVQNLEYAKGIIEAANTYASPVIIQLSSRTLAFFGMDEILTPCLIMAEKATVPVCVHLDHAKDTNVIQQAIKAGFTSVMYDGSALPLEENIRNSKQVVAWAKEKNISVEAEVGVVGNDEENKNIEIEIRYTQTNEVRHFLEEVAVDALAVSLGSVHGMSSSTASLDLELLSQLQSIIKVPLVLHGSSGVIDQDIANAIPLGIRKINVATKLKNAVGKNLYELSRSKGLEELSNALNLSKMMQAAVKETVLERLSLFKPSIN